MDTEETYRNVYKGTLNEVKMDVSWKKAAFLRKPRSGHVVFKLNQTVYVAGGYHIDKDNTTRTCIEYSIKKNSWSRGTNLPFKLDKAVATTNTNEDFALIFSSKKDRNKKLMLRAI